MENKFEFVMLLDVYGDLLTEKQYFVLDKYYNEDYSLAEIAENLNISRQGVHDIIRKCRVSLREYEDKIGYISKMNEIKKGLSNLKDSVSDEKVIDDIDNLINNI